MLRGISITTAGFVASGTGFQMLLAAHMAGLAFATTGLGLGHAIAHALGAHVNAVHGAALAVVVPHVLRFNLPARPEVVPLVARALCGHQDGRDGAAGAETAIECVREMAHRLHLHLDFAGARFCH